MVSYFSNSSFFFSSFSATSSLASSFASSLVSSFLSYTAYVRLYFLNSRYLGSIANAHASIITSINTAWSAFFRSTMFPLPSYAIFS